MAVKKTPIKPTQRRSAAGSMRTTKARHTATPTKPGRPSRTAADDPLSGHRVQYLVAAFGGATVAGWVG